MSQKLNRQARLETISKIAQFYDYGDVSLHQAARLHAKRLAEDNLFTEAVFPIEVRCETSPEIPPAVFSVKVELVATVLDPRGETDKQETTFFGPSNTDSLLDPTE